jgi:7-cyano-7-deazaguanine synthase
MKKSKALVLFSGGQDSSTCLAWALDRFDEVETIGFDYGQRHAVELTCRTTILNHLRDRFPAWGKKLGQDHLIEISVLKSLGETALTGDVEITTGENGLPTTFVPGRNLVFLIFAGAVAYRRGAKHLIAGMCETDYSGYPDCRDDTLKALQVALNLGMEKRFSIDTPLMWADKAEIWEMSYDLGGKVLVDLIKENTHSCYRGDRKVRHPWGYGCDACPACEVRAVGYEKFANKILGFI